MVFESLTIEPAGSDNQLQYNNNGELGAITGFETNGSNILKANDSSFFIAGNSNDLTISHDGTNNNIISNTGNLTIDNTNINGDTINRLGSNTNSTSFQVRNDSNNILLQVDGDGLVTVNDRITGVSEPINSDDVSTKNYVDTEIQNSTNRWHDYF